MALSHKILAVNLASANLNEYAPQVLKALAAFKDKAYLSTGEKSKKYKELLESLNLPHAHDKKIRVYALYHNLIIKSRVSVPTSANQCLYHQEDFHAGRIEQQKIELNKEYEPLKSDWTLAEIEAAQAQVKELEAQIYKIKTENKLHKYENVW